QAEGVRSHQPVLLADQQRVVEGRFLQELEHIFFEIDGYADNLGVLGLPLHSYLIEQWNLAAAGGTPGGPEVHHQWPAAKTREFGGFAVFVGERDVGKRVWNPLHLR